MGGRVQTGDLWSSIGGSDRCGPRSIWSHWTGPAPAFQTVSVEPSTALAAGKSGSAFDASTLAPSATLTAPPVVGPSVGGAVGAAPGRGVVSALPGLGQRDWEPTAQNSTCPPIMDM